MKKILLLAFILCLNQQFILAQLHQKEDIQMNENLKIQLINSARQAREKAYAPYSNYLVGAALLTDQNEIIPGCNVENASYGLTCCAERVAIFKAVSEGVTNFKAIAISLSGGGYPCGACRQVLNEFNPHLIVLIADEEGNLKDETTLTELLPKAFGPQNLN